jgi:hypothetical protein
MARVSSGAHRSARSAPTRRLESLAAGAEYADVSTRTIRRYIAQGLLTGYRCGPRLVKVDLNEIDEKLIRPIPTAGGGAA